MWYNGKFNSLTGVANEINTQVSQAAVYDNFIVPSGTWNINTVWSNNLMNFTTLSQAYWEIRSGVSAGDGGTLAGQRHRRGHANRYGAFNTWFYGVHHPGGRVERQPGTWRLLAECYSH